MDSRRGLSALPRLVGQLSVWAWRLQSVVQASSTNLTTVLCVESQMGMTYLSYITQPRVSRTGPGTKVCHVPEPFSLPGCLHTYVLGKSQFA